ncbi:hypothetical protein N24_2341 [Corynebacterium suranareeae]|uniref:Uncharacterized protein n=1 Tax=Corynebacterium suranareeae TaxID=2506452 RepID=A0A160PTK6_9CORY|nr:hypothetical protein N24_2341 [Corynebacterium suranareeae]
MTSYTSWGKRFKKEGKLFINLLRGADEEVLATFGEVPSKAFETIAEVDDQKWELSFDIEGTASAKLPDGRTFSANAGEKTFTKSKRIDIDMDGTEMAAINEEKNNWIIDDAQEQKVAQFTGLNNGMRRAILEFEEDAKVAKEQEIFLSWIARKTLESRMLGSSWGLTLFLIVLTPIIIFLTFS